MIPAAGAALAYGIAAALGGSGFIAAFVGGMVFRRALGRDPEELNRLTEEVGEVLNGVTFVLFGAILLGPALGELSWELALYAVLSLTLVRMLPVAIAMLGTHARLPTLGFLGWFGPRGLASIVFAVIVIEESQLPHEHLIVLAIYLTVGLSVFAHGLTAAPLADRYARWYERHPRDKHRRWRAPRPRSRALAGRSVAWQIDRRPTVFDTINVLAPLQISGRLASGALGGVKRRVESLDSVLVNIGPALEALPGIEVLAREHLPTLQRAVPVVEGATSKVDGLSATVETASDKVDPLIETIDRALPVIEEAIETMQQALPVLERAAEMAEPLEGTVSRIGRLSDRLPGGERLAVGGRHHELNETPTLDKEKTNAGMDRETAGQVLLRIGDLLDQAGG